MDLYDFVIPFAVACIATMAFCIRCIVVTWRMAKAARDFAAQSEWSARASQRQAERAEGAARRASLERSCAEECVNALDNRTDPNRPRPQLKLADCDPDGVDMDPLGISREA